MTFDVHQAKMLEILKPSGIRKMFARAAGLEGVISLGIGAPDLQPPEGLLESLKNQLDKRSHAYTLNNGIAPLHDKIRTQYTEEYNLDMKETDVIIGAGATQLLYGAIFGYTNPGDEVIVPDPGFVYYPTIPLMAGCTVKPISLDDDFQMSADLVAETVSQKTKMMIINTPGNPTGAILNKDSLKAIADLAIDNDVIILSDEVYEFMAFDGEKHIPMAQLAPDHTITLNSFSKTYCVPGWRLGYAIGNRELLAPLSKIHPFMVANAPSLSQFAIADFMGTDEDKAFRKQLNTVMQKRRDVVVEEFGKIDGVQFPKVSGSFYAFPKIVSPHYPSDNPGYDFAEDIFENTKVVTVAGSEFGDSRNDHFRISFGSASTEKITEAADRIRTYIESK
ncbi:MAG: pyridoxal phosphate-dependent aminotransferase [Candidatus Heimdallarchaeota archaeon]|nr:pyridoxal phosphate-dependent aminotransferase [Candidatus Heimdallarchaeota archaeon]